MMRLFFIYLCFILGLSAYAHADYMLPELAFQTNIIQLPDNQLDIHFKIASGYDIYQDKIHINAVDGSLVKIGKPKFPSAIKEHNDIMGDYYVYKNTADIIVPIIDKGNGKLTLNLRYQGCKGLDYCYPEISETKIVTLKDLPTSNTVTTQNVEKTKSENLEQHSLTSFKTLTDATNSTTITHFFANSFWLVILGFFVVGILLAASPCVFPMLPILFTIIAGQNASFKRSLALSSSYVLGMASAYALAGVIFAAFGSNLQTILQSSITNYVLAVIFIVFSLSLFGLFDIRLPHALQNKLSGNKTGSSNILGTYIAGAVSTVVLSPCITAPLAGALLYIASTGNVVLGASALFAMGIGCGLPLLIIAVFGNKVLPRNGNWLLIIKDVLAFLMLAMAVYVGTRALSSEITMLAIAGMLIIAGAYFLLSRKYFNLKYKSVFTVLNILIILLAGYMIGNIYSSTQAQKYSNSAQQDMGIKSGAIVVDNIVSLDKELNIAKNLKRPVMLDFTASWCMACKELAATTFKDKAIVNSLKSFQVIEVDITKNNADTKALMGRYKVMAPPSLIFIDKEGNPVPDKNILGFISSDKLLPILKSFYN